MEKFLLEWAETRSPDHLDQALALVEKPSKARSSSYQMALLRSGIETRRGNLAQSRHILTTAMQRSDLDWPEMIYESLTQLEAVHGDLDSIKSSRMLIERESEKLAKRRQKAYVEYQPAPADAAPAAAPAPAAEEKLQR